MILLTLHHNWLTDLHWLTDWLTYTDWLTDLHGSIHVQYLPTTGWLAYLLTYIGYLPTCPTVACYCRYWLTYLLLTTYTDWLTHLHILTDRLTDLHWLTDWLTDWLTYTDWLTDRPTYTDWLTDWLTDRWESNERSGGASQLVYI